MPVDGNVGASVGSFPGPLRLVHSEEFAAETIDLWLLDTDTDDEVRVDASVLDDDERRHLDALETPGVRRRYLLRHAALRHLLGQALSLPPRDVCIVREACPRCGEPGGRPVLGEQTAPLHFSMSSSEQFVLLGLASATIGVDVETVPSLRAVGEASELLHPAERDELLSMAPEARQAAFTRLWSRKEACLKGIGVGVAHGLADEYLGTRPRAVVPAGWTLLDVPVPPGFFASAALKTPPHTSGLGNHV